MAKKKAKPAKNSAPKKSKPAKKPPAKKAVAKKSKAAKLKPAKAVKAAKKKSPPKKKKPAAKKPAARSPRLSAPASYVRIDHATQGLDGHETPADRLSIRSDDFLWLYVEAELPGGAAPQGEYSKTAAGSTASPQPLGPPENINGQYRFMVIHFALSPASTYQFRFADDVAAPTYQDQWEIATVPAG